MKKVHLLVLIGVLALATPGLAAADPINITGGYLDMNPSFGPIVLTGDRGFTFSSGVGTTGGIFQPTEQCNFDPLHCTAGSTLDLRAAFSGNDLTGTATLDGVTYVHVGALDSSSSMSVSFSGSLVLPPLAASAAVTAPFLFSGTFFHPISTTEFVNEILAGGGFATLSLTPHRAFPGSWHLDHARYDFARASAAPTPEPGPLLLVGAGLLAAAAMFKRGARKTRAL